MDPSESNGNLVQHYDNHFNRYKLENYNMPHLLEEPLDPSKLPSDDLPVENEGMAPPVKSAWRPNSKSV